jgi:hypothetical protein
MANPMSDGERPQPKPPVYPPQVLPLPSETDSDGIMHSPTIKWPAAGGPDDARLPYKNLR